MQDINDVNGAHKTVDLLDSLGSFGSFDLLDLKIAIQEVLSANKRIDLEDHISHHTWIRAHIQAETDRQELYKDIRHILMQWFIPILCTAIAAIIYFILHGEWPIYYFN